MKYCTRGHLMEKTRKIHSNGDAYCGECRIIRTKEFISKNPEKVKIYNKKSKIAKAYGIDLIELMEIYNNQGNRCAICKKDIKVESKDFQVDHCHKEGHVRGILCMKCNLALGFMKDNVVILQSAINYLNNDMLSKLGKSKKK